MNGEYLIFIYSLYNIFPYVSLSTSKLWNYKVSVEGSARHAEYSNLELRSVHHGILLIIPGLGPKPGPGVSGFGLREPERLRV